MGWPWSRPSTSPTAASAGRRSRPGCICREAREAGLPAVVQYQGYGGGRGLAHEDVLFALAGYAHLVMDTRGQGSAWSVGETADAGAAGEPSHPGFMTRGILDPAQYYYRRVFTDAVRAVEAVRANPAIDPTRVAVTGGSQGGGITLAVAGLVPDLVGAAPDVPFLCDFPRATTLVDSDPYGEVVRYLKVHRDHVEAARRTLTYFDGTAMARRAPRRHSSRWVSWTRSARPPRSTPPTTTTPVRREIVEYPFNEHEGGAAFHQRAKLAWLARNLREMDGR